MRLRDRLHPLDVALGAVVLAGVAWLLVAVPEYRWTGAFEGGFVRRVPVRVTLEVLSPVQAGLAAELGTGPRELEAGQSVGRVVIEDNRPGEEGRTRLVLRLEAELDRDDRLFWWDTRLRRGESLTLADRERRISGLITALERLDRASP